jgi:hypothetical protein
MDPSSLLVGLLVSLVGTAYIVYGRKQGNPVALLCGLGLTLVPWFVLNPWLLFLICMVLIVIPLRIGT